MATLEELTRTVQTRKPCLCVAAHDGSLAIVRLLVDAGAHVNTRRGLSLIVAVDAGHLSMVQLLLARGADPNASNGEPYKLARHTRRDDILRALLESATAVLGEPATRGSSELTSEPTAHAIGLLFPLVPVPSFEGGASESCTCSVGRRVIRGAVLYVTAYVHMRGVRKPGKATAIAGATAHLCANDDAQVFKVRRLNVIPNQAVQTHSGSVGQR